MSILTAWMKDESVKWNHTHNSKPHHQAELAVLFGQMAVSAVEYDSGLAVKTYEKALQYPHNPHKAEHQQALDSLTST